MSVWLEIKDVGHEYAGRPVLRGCRLGIGPGVTALMGHNGSGKSTLLRICALLEKPTEGRVVYLEDRRELPPDMALRRRLTLVLPRGGLFNASVRYNAGYGLRVRGVRKAERKQLAMDALEAVGLSHLARQNALTLSSGEAQRLALARAIAIKPDVLFLDEPTASVDEESTEVIEKLVLDMSTGKAGAPHIPTIAFTTHDRDQTERLAPEQVITMRRGSIEGG